MVLKHLRNIYVFRVFLEAYKNGLRHVLALRIFFFYKFIDILSIYRYSMSQCISLPDDRISKIFTNSLHNSTTNLNLSLNLPVTSLTCACIAYTDSDKH